VDKSMLFKLEMGDFFENYFSSYNPLSGDGVNDHIFARELS